MSSSNSEFGESGENTSSSESDESFEDLVNFSEWEHGAIATSTSNEIDEPMDASISLESRSYSPDMMQGSQPSLLSLPTPVAAKKITWTDGVRNVEPRPFSDPTCGFTSDFSRNMIEYDFWKLVFTSEALNMVVRESNEYFIKTAEEKAIPSRRQMKFNIITHDEMLRYFAIRIIMGINKKPELSHYWSKDPFLSSDVVPKIMSSDRFKEITQYLHFYTESEDSDEADPDKLKKIRGLWKLVNDNFKQLLIPFENVSVDESLVKFRGRLSFRQFIPSKRSRFGVKTFSVVDERTGFILQSIIYAGKQQNIQSKYDKCAFGYGGAVVLDLCEDYLGVNRTIFCDNYFTSPVLAEELLKKHTYICGTVRQNRKLMPDAPKMKKGEVITKTCDINGEPILLEYWRDKRVVRMLSTGLPHDMVECQSRSGKEQSKPKTVKEYNSKARGIDLSDMHMHNYDSARKTVKWSTKMFYRLLEMTIYNAYRMKCFRGSDQPFLEFRLNLAKQILEQTGGFKSKTVKAPSNDLDRLTGRHFPSKSTVRRCKVCTLTQQSKKDQYRSNYECKECGVGLCVSPCFEIWHTRKIIK